MLIDTQANGTAVVYDPTTSLRARVHDDLKDTVKFTGGLVNGVVTEDYFCLDQSEDICPQDFSFISVKQSDFSYSQVKNVEVGGVLGLNRYNS